MSSTLRVSCETQVVVHLRRDPEETIISSIERKKPLHRTKDLHKNNINQVKTINKIATKTSKANKAKFKEKWCSFEPGYAVFVYSISN